jgi:hypothetical protein
MLENPSAVKKIDQVSNHLAYYRRFLVINIKAPMLVRWHLEKSQGVEKKDANAPNMGTRKILRIDHKIREPGSSSWYLQYG